jgi:alpha-D-ribose 1-methylphosphonate 5-triphosphate synthase subunit PhnH
MSAVDGDVDAHRCFRAVLMALALPGRPQASPVPPASTPALVLRSIWEPGQAGEAVRVVYGDPGPRTLEEVPRGTDAEPQLGGTVLLVAGLDGPRTRVWLEGPGLSEPTPTLLPLSHEALESRARACASPPTGIDLVIVTPEGIVGLPRTTRVEIDPAGSR